MRDSIKYRLVSALMLIFSSLALNARDCEVVCDPDDFRLAPGECFSVAVDSAAGGISVGLSVDFPRKALEAAKARAVLTFVGNGGSELCRAELSIAADPATAGFEEPALRLKVDSATTSGANVCLVDFYTSRDIHPSGGIHSLLAEWADGNLSFQIGGDRLTPAGGFKLDGEIDSLRLQVSKPMYIRRFCVKRFPDYSQTLMTHWTIDSLAAYFSKSGDPVEGFWSFLDRDNDPAWAIPGGFYELAIVRSATEAKAYDIIYLGGAKVDASRWREGMRKGRLRPTIFADHYSMEWTDSRFNADYEEITADVSAEGTILTLNFPLYHSKLRFSKRPLAK